MWLTLHIPQYVELETTPSGDNYDILINNVNRLGLGKVKSVGVNREL